MTLPDRNLKVFVSSTSKDLEDYRAVARLAILDMDWKPDMMEHFESMPIATVDACYEKLSQSQLVVLIVAFRRGWVPTEAEGGNGKDSVTALELKYALEHNIPVLALLARDTWPGNLWEHDAEARDWMDEFRDSIKKHVTPGSFDYEASVAKESERLPTFRAKLRTDLVSHRARLLENYTPAAEGVSRKQLESASAALSVGLSIPFLGQGVFGRGPLSPESLVQALGDADLGESCLATASEYRERSLRSREAFLHELERIIIVQAAQAEMPAVYDLLCRIRPPLIVSTTHDLLLEKHLEANGKQVLIVCHVVRSREGAQDGKVVVFRGLSDKEPKLCLADQVGPIADKETYVVYKPLGSPFLHAQLDPELEIDTVVATETDHLVFLSRFEHQGARVPTAFSRPLQKYPSAFLGYPLDVWQYRLVAQVFQSIGVTGKSPDSFAMRVPASVMEELAWRKLLVDPLQMDPNDFARTLSTKLGPRT